MVQSYFIDRVVIRMRKKGEKIGVSSILKIILLTFLLCTWSEVLHEETQQESLNPS